MAGHLPYPGAVVHGDGKADSEISRKLGAARGDFRQLTKLWNHAKVPAKAKLKCFQALIVSKLIHGLSTMWLVTPQRRRVDGFHVRCLRRILRIPVSFVSRVSNATVLGRAGARPFSEQLLQRQPMLLDKIPHSPGESLLRRDIFIPGTVQPQIGRYVRRVGHPRQNWTEQLLREGAARLGATKFQSMLADCS